MTSGIRIGGGSYGGRRVSSPRRGLRPTSAIVKKSLFDTLGDSVSGCSFLDLFAGSGAVGIEALSRGAALVVFVDVHFQSMERLKRSLSTLGADPASFEVICSDYRLALEQLRNRSLRFDIIYVDPPYGEIQPARVLGDIETSKVLAEEGLVVYETARRDLRQVLDSLPPKLYPVRERTHGSTALLFLRWR